MMNATASILRKTLVYVITLPNSVDRQAMFGDDVARQRVEREWSFFSGFTSLSPALGYDAKRALAARGRPLHARELACYSSHYEAWRSFLDTDAHQLVVLEDDVHLDWVFLDRVVSRDLNTEGLDYLKLFSKNMTPYRVISNDFHGRWLLDCRGYAYGMQAYILTRAGARRFLDHCGGTIERPVDDELDRSWVHGVPNLTVFPFPAFERSGPSSIGADRDRFAALTPGLQLARYHARAKERLLRMSQKITGFGLAKALPAYPSRRFGVSHVQNELL